MELLWRWMDARRQHMALAARRFREFSRLDPDDTVTRALSALVDDGVTSGERASRLRDAQSALDPNDGLEQTLLILVVEELAGL